MLDNPFTVPNLGDALAAGTDATWHVGTVRSVAGTNIQIEVAGSIMAAEAFVGWPGIGDAVWVLFTRGKKLVICTTDAMNSREFNAFNPAISNITLGVGGTSTAIYTWSGGPNVGERGMIYMSGVVIFGSSGMAITAVRPTFTCPAGFNLTGTYPSGNMAFFKAGGIHPGQPHTLSGTTWGYFIYNVAGTYAILADLNTAVPAAVGAGDIWYWCCHIEAIRV
jgi:hypothetical protein